MFSVVSVLVPAVIIITGILIWKKRAHAQFVRENDPNYVPPNTLPLSTLRALHIHTPEYPKVFRRKTYLVIWNH